MNVATRRRALAWVTAALAVVTTAGPGAAAKPRKPVLEVYFLLDGTSSMNMAVPGLLSVVDHLVWRLGRLTTLRHGFGVYRMPLDSVPHPVYERLSPVQPDGGRTPTRYLADRAYSRGGYEDDDRHAPLTQGLYGTLGVQHLPWLVAPQPAEFSAGAVRRLVVVVTNASADRGLGEPELEETGGRLQAAGVAVAALTPERPPSLGGPAADLALLSTRTGGVARTAFDCDGDGRVDVRRGEPLRCEFDGLDGDPLLGFEDALAAWAR